MSFAVSTPSGPVEIVEKVGDVTYGSILLDAEGNKYVPQKQGYGALPLEVAEAMSEQDEETPGADDGPAEGEVESSSEGEGTGEEA